MSSSMNGRVSFSGSALIESLVSGERQGVGGILCNDPHGLCLASEGQTTTALSSSGVYTNLVRLAAQLQSLENNSNGNAGDDNVPLITLETCDKAILVKDYSGYAVAVQIPKKSASSLVSSATSAAASTNTTTMAATPSPPPPTVTEEDEN